MWFKKQTNYFNNKYKDGASSLYIASFKGNLEVVKYLVEICKCDVNLIDKVCLILYYLIQKLFKLYKIWLKTL